jgi:hypothetical protein
MLKRFEMVYFVFGMFVIFWFIQIAQERLF